MTLHLRDRRGHVRSASEIIDYGADPLMPFSSGPSGVRTDRDKAIR